MPAKKKTTETRKPAFAQDTEFREPSKEHKEAFIARYLATMSNDAVAELARLAASMATRAKAFDANALVAQAIAIREEAALTVPARHAVLLAGADWFSLNALWYRIAGSRSRAETDKDPHLVAIIEAMKQLNEAQTKAWNESPERDRERAEREDILAAVEAVSGPRPALPCPLETAFHWSISAKDAVSWKLIEESFIDFLTVYEASERHIKDTDSKWGRRQEAEAWLERHRQALANRKLAAEHQDVHGDVRSGGGGGADGGDSHCEQRRG